MTNSEQTNPADLGINGHSTKPKGMRFKVAKQVVVTVLKQVLFGGLCTAAGAIICLNYLTKIETAKMAALVKEYAKQTEKLAETVEYHHVWKELVDNYFREHEGALQRIEFNMRIPRHEHTTAKEQYRKFNESQPTR